MEPAKINPNDFKSKLLFDEVEKGLQREGEALVSKVKGIFVFKVKGGTDIGTGIWTVDCKSGSGSVEFGKTKKADCTVRMKDRHIMKIILGRLKIQKAMMEGKIRIKGNIGLLMKLKDYRKKIKEMQAVIVDALETTEINGIYEDESDVSNSELDEQESEKEEISSEVTLL